MRTRSATQTQSYTYRATNIRTGGDEPQFKRRVPITAPQISKDSKTTEKYESRFANSTQIQEQNSKDVKVTNHLSKSFDQCKSAWLSLKFQSQRMHQFTQDSMKIRDPNFNHLTLNLKQVLIIHTQNLIRKDAAVVISMDTFSTFLNY
eukprot:403373093